MKKVLITGANSYIGTSFEQYVKDDENFKIFTVDTIDEAWKEIDFSKYDVVFHVAGIAHADIGNATEQQKHLYYKVNTDLAVEVAKRAKQNGVKQFIFMSSMIVYGGCANNVITASTEPCPVNFYGDSKWQADKKIQELNDGSFNVVILRPPMIYGKNSKGNYLKLSKIASKVPFFPKVNNKRSMLYIGNLCEFLKLIILNNESGVFFPQNSEYTNTSEMVKMISKVKKHKLLLVPGFNRLINLMKKSNGKIGILSQKAFGDSYYEQSMSEYKQNYCKYSLSESINLTEGDFLNSKNVLIVASVASMIDQFNMPNIDLLKNMGYIVDVACNFEKGNTCSKERIDYLRNELIKKNIGCYQIGFERNVFNVFKNVKAIKNLVDLMKSKNYYFVHCHSPIGGIAARIAGKITDTRVIYTAHGFHFYKGAPLKNWLFFYPVEKFLSKYTDTLITINKEDYNFANKKLKAKNFTYIPGVGIDCNRFKNLNIDVEKKRTELRLDINDKVIISVGELNDNKNQQAIIKALSKINNRNIKYLVCGVGPKEKELKQLRESLGLNDQVIFLGYRDDIPELLKISDIFVFPSIREGFPVSVLEALASGLPLVTSNIRGINDYAENGITGFHYEPNDVEGFATGITKLVNDEKLYKRISAYNFDLAQEYDFSTLRVAFENIYK